MDSLIGPQDYLPLLSAILGLVWFGFWTEKHKVLCKVPGVVWILVLAALLSNFHILPFGSPLYGIVFGYLLPLAVPLLLFKATFKKIFTESGKILPIFLLGSVAVCIGGFIAYGIFDLGPTEAKILATYVAAWIGGMVNMVALSEMTQMEPSQFSIAVSASAPASIIGLTILCMLPSFPFIRRHFPSKIMDKQEKLQSQGGPSMQAEDVPFSLPHIVGALALSALICTCSQLLIKSGIFPDSWNIKTYNLFIITMIAIILANIFAKPIENLKGDFELGMLLMYMFFAAIGATTDAVTFLTEAPLYFAFGMTILLVHIALILLCAKIFKWDLAEVIIGSGANIVGAAPAAGIASSKGWKNLVTPAIATGMLGYAIANFFGLAIYKLLG